MRLSDFDYDLPAARIAQYPTAARGATRLMVVDRRTGGLSVGRFAELGGFLRPGDALVLNDSKVVPARMHGVRRGTGGRVEVMVLRRVAPAQYEALLRARGRVGVGDAVEFGHGVAIAQVVSRSDGTVVLGFRAEREARRCFEACGDVPLPPYIARAPEAVDRVRYQTVYARHPGSVAAPTAGLHFTTAHLARLHAQGVRTVAVTLHIGYGTFEPIRSEEVTAHRMRPEAFVVSADASQQLRAAARAGGRLVAVGSTACRVLETVAATQFAPRRGVTDLFLYPGYTFRAVRALLTNFHLPRTTLFLLVCAFAGRALILRAYRRAMAEGFQFYSYGDAMLIV